MRGTRGEAEIAPFRAGDEREIPALVQSVHGENYDRRFYEPPSIARMVGEGLFLVTARRGGRLAGMTGFRAEAGSNRRLFRTYRRMVAPEARGLGLARAMEELGERFLIKEGLPGVFYAQVEASSPSNRLLSECGFALTAVEPAVGERAADLFVQKIGVCSRRTGRDGLAECGVYGVGRPAGAKDRRSLRRARFVRRARSGLERRGR